MPRILHLLDHSLPLHSGYTFRTQAILEHQRARGWETFHITSTKHRRPYIEAEEVVDGLHFYRTPPIHSWIGNSPLLNQWLVVEQLVRRLREVIPRVNPTILHAHSPALNGLAGLRASRQFGIPLVYEVRAFWEDAAVDHGTSREGGLRYRATRALETYVLRHADAVTTICEGLRNEIMGRGVASDKVMVIPNGVDLNSFHAEYERDHHLANELGFKSGPVLGFIGSFYGYEGLRLLIKAIPTITSRYPGIRVLLVGGGPEDTALRALAAQVGVANKVIFTGRISHDQIHRYYGLVDLFVYPRLSMRLTELVTPLKPLEAMAQGRLVIASNVGGHRELIIDRETGWLFDAGDFEALAQCVIEVLADRNRWPLVRHQARKFIENERTWSTTLSQYDCIYASLRTRGVFPKRTTINQGLRRQDG